MLLNKTSENAIKIVFFILDRSRGEYLQIRPIADQLELPYYQTAKIVQTLIRAHVLISCTGPKGGVRLNENAEALSLMQIVEIFEGRDLLNKCFLNIEDCRAKTPCMVHHLWQKTKLPLATFLKDTPLEQIISLRPSIPELNPGA